MVGDVLQPIANHCSIPSTPSGAAGPTANRRRRKSLRSHGTAMLNNAMHRDVHVILQPAAPQGVFSCG